MTTLTEKFAAFEGQEEDNHTEVMGLIETMNENIGGIGEQIVILNNAMQAGFRDLIAAQGQAAACFPCPTPSIVVPVTSPTTTPVDTEHCQRSQWIIAAIHRILSNMDTLQSFNVVGSFSVLNDAISEIMGEIAAGDTIPLPSFPETVQIVGTYISYAGERLFSGVSMLSQFAPLEESLISAVFNATDAASAQSAYNAVIDGAGVSTAAGFLFKAVGYNALWSYALDPLTMPDLSGFDGMACSIASGACFTFNLVDMHFDNGSHFQGINVPVGLFTPALVINTSSGPVTSDEPAFFDGSLVGWTAEGLTGHTFIFFRAGDISSSGTFDTSFSVGPDGIAHAIPGPMGSFFFNGDTDGVIRLCKI